MNIAKNIFYFIILVTPLLMFLSRVLPPLLFSGISIFFIICTALEISFSKKYNDLKYQLTKNTSFILIFLFIFMLLSCAWTPAQFRGLSSTIGFFSVILLFLTTLPAFKFVTQDIPKFAYAHVFIIIATSALILIDISFSFSIREIFGGSGENFRLNRSAVALVLFLPLALFQLPRTLKGYALGILATGAVYAAVFISESESAKLAALLSPCGYLLAYTLRRSAVLVLLAGVLITFVGMPWIAPWIPEFLPLSVADQVGYGYSTVGIRADMWAAFASLIEYKPLFGHGMEASHKAGETYQHLPIENRLLGFGHTHNFAMQVWYELGALGIFLFSALITIFCLRLRQLPLNYIAPVVSTTGAAWVVFMVSHGAWQAWWWSLLGLLVFAWMIELYRPGKTEKR